MTYEFDKDAKRIIGHFKKEGYSLNSTLLQTVNIHDSQGHPVNAYMEPHIAELSKEETCVRIEFYLTHERKAKRGLIKSLSITPPTKGLADILESKEGLADILGAVL